MSWFEPVAVDIEEAMVGPVATGAEERHQEDGTVDARPADQIVAEQEDDDECG